MMNVGVIITERFMSVNGQHRNGLHDETVCVLLDRGDR